MGKTLVFIIHAEEDDDPANEVVDELVGPLGLPGDVVFVDHAALRDGVTWPTTRDAALADAAVVVVLVSEAFLVSGESQREAIYARDARARGEKDMLPVWLMDPDDARARAEYLRDIQGPKWSEGGAPRAARSALDLLEARGARPDVVLEGEVYRVVAAGDWSPSPRKVHQAFATALRAWRGEAFHWFSPDGSSPWRVRTVWPSEFWEREGVLTLSQRSLALAFPKVAPAVQGWVDNCLLRAALWACVLSSAAKGAGATPDSEVELSMPLPLEDEWALGPPDGLDLGAGFVKHPKFTGDLSGKWRIEALADAPHTQANRVACEELWNDLAYAWESGSPWSSRLDLTKGAGPQFLTRLYSKLTCRAERPPL